MAKYTQDQINALGAKGHAFKNADGHYSYPVDDTEDLHNAIRAVGRGGADHDAIRKYVIGRARALGQSPAIPGNWNADGSLKGSAAALRPPEWAVRRKRWAGSLIGQSGRRSMHVARGNIEIRGAPDGSGGTNYIFRGYSSTFDDPFEMWDKWGDPYEESVRSGSFTETLGRPDLDVPFLIGHNDAGIPMARTRSGTMRLSQDSRGLHTEASLSGRRSDVRDLADAVDRGDMDEMSIGFVTRDQEWSEDWEKRTLTNIDLHRGDVSVVALAANPATRGATMIAMPGEQAWGASWQPGAEELMLDGTAKRLPVIDAALCQAQKLLAGAAATDTPEFAQGMQLLTSAGIHVNHIIKHEGLPDPGKGQLSAAGQERRDDASGTIVNNSDAPDYNPGAATTGGAALHPPMTGTHAHDHAAYGTAGHGSHSHQHVADSSHAHGHQYNADGTIVLDDSGVVEEVGGAMADADLLKRRLRLLELA